MTTGTVARYNGPSSLAERLQYAAELCRSYLLPDVFRGREANVLWALEYAASLNVPTMTAITGIHVIEGKPSASAGLMTALVRRAGHTFRIRVTGSVAAGDIQATATIIRSDDPEHPFTSTWTLDRALRAKLIERLDVDEKGRTIVVARTKKGEAGAWQKYTEAMLKARAESEVCRDAAEECLHGLHYTPDELGADIDLTDDGRTVVVGEVLSEGHGDGEQPTPEPGQQALHAARRALEASPADLRQIAAWVQEQGLGQHDVSAVIDRAPHLQRQFGEDRTLDALLTHLQAAASEEPAPTPAPKPAQRRREPQAVENRPQEAAPAARPGSDDQDDNGRAAAAYRVAAAAAAQADVDTLRRSYGAAKPLHDIDVRAALTEDQLAYVPIPDGQPVPLGAWLMACGKHTATEGLSIDQTIAADPTRDRQLQEA